jgi:hypothetical protein
MSVPRTLLIGGFIVFSLFLSSCSSDEQSPASTQQNDETGSSTPSDGLPATGAVNGMIFEVTSSPRVGRLGSTRINATATLKGEVAGDVVFEISDQADATVGEPSSTQSVRVDRPGTVSMPKSFQPKRAGTWSVTAIYKPSAEGLSTLRVSGLPVTPGSGPPFPQLVTIVSP